MRGGEWYRHPVTHVPRLVEPERLDSLPAGDPAAIRSRRDLQRLNLVMGQAGSIARRLLAHGGTRGMRRLVDLGGGDGTLLLRLARRLAPRCGAARAVVVDRHALVTAATTERFERLGWTLEAVTAEVSEWLSRDPVADGTVIVANLFLHHFEDAPLRELLSHVAPRTGRFVACEPRRARFTLGAVRLMGLIGCSSLTREDGLISVRAGFAGRELSELWPTGDGWETEEGPAGLFSHCFVASRRQG